MLRAEFVHIGVAIDIVGQDPARSVGPWIVTQDLAAPLTSNTAYVVGAVFTEKDGSHRYVAGSGYGDVEIVFEGPTGTFQTTSWSAGGYQIQLPPGTYRGLRDRRQLASPARERRNRGRPPQRGR